MKPPDTRTSQAARKRIEAHIRVTPVLALDVPAPSGARRIAAQLESLQVTGSFKPRGAFNALLPMDAREFVACSGGTHGLAVAHSAALPE